LLVTVKIDGGMKAMEDFLDYIQRGAEEIGVDLTVTIEEQQWEVGSSVSSSPIGPPLEGFGADDAWVKKELNSLEHSVSKRTIDPALAELGIDELELGVRAFNCLKRAEIITLGQLVGKSEKELRKIPNMGEKGIRDIVEKLSERGLSLRE